MDNIEEGLLLERADRRRRAPPPPSMTRSGGITGSARRQQQASGSLRGSEQSAGAGSPLQPADNVEMLLSENQALKARLVALSRQVRGCFRGLG